MKMMTAWNPFQELEAIQNQYLQALNLNPADRGQSSPRPASDWVPPVDITEDPNGYQIRADLPAVRKDDVQITLEDGILSIRGERRMVNEENGPKHIRIERRYGSFSRSFSIPDDADDTQVTADYHDGVLHIHLPKSEAKKPRQIQVRVN